MIPVAHQTCLPAQAAITECHMGLAETISHLSGNFKPEMKVHTGLIQDSSLDLHEEKGQPEDVA